MKEVFSSAHTVSNLAKNVDQHRILYVVRDQLAKQLALHITDALVKEDVGDFSTTYSMRLVVADEDHFWRCVQREALELQSRLNLPVWERST